MAVTFDAKMTGGNGDTGRCQQVNDGTSMSSTGMTIGASATLLVAVIIAQTSTANISNLAMTWNSVTMTPGPVQAISGSGNFVTAAIFYKVSPTTGNQTLAASWTSTADAYMSCVSFNGTDTSTGIATADNKNVNNVTQIDVPNSADGATVAVFGVNGADPTVDQTEIYSQAPLDPGGGASYCISVNQNGAASGLNRHTFTNGGGQIQALAGVHVITGGAATTPITKNDLPVDSLAGGEIV